MPFMPRFRLETDAWLTALGDRYGRRGVMGDRAGDVHLMCSPGDSKGEAAELMASPRKDLESIVGPIEKTRSSVAALDNQSQWEVDGSCTT